MRFSANDGCEAADAAWIVDVWMRGCLGLCGQVARACEGGGCDPGLQDVKTSGIRRLSLTRDMRHGGRLGDGGAVCCLPCCAVLRLPSAALLLCAMV